MPHMSREAQMFDYATIKNQVTDYVSEYEQDYDIDGIMDELRERYGWAATIDDIDQDEFVSIVESYDTSAQ